MQLFPQATWFKALTMSCWCSYGDYVVVLIWDGQKGLTNEKLSSLKQTNNCVSSKTFLKIISRKFCHGLKDTENWVVLEALEIHQTPFQVKDPYVNAVPLFLNLEDWVTKKSWTLVCIQSLPLLESLTRTRETSVCPWSQGITVKRRENPGYLWWNKLDVKKCDFT